MLNVNELSGFGSGGDASTEPHRYWRLRVTQPTDYTVESVELNELEFRSISTGSVTLTGDDITVPVPARATPISDVAAWNAPAFSSPTIGITTPAYQPASCFNDSVTGAPTWCPDDLGSGWVGAYIGYDFSVPVVVREVLVVSQSVDGPIGIAFEYSDDNTNWQVSKEFRDTRSTGTYWPSRFRVFTLF